MKNKRPFFYTLGISLGAVFAIYNMIFNKDNDNYIIALSAPIIIYVSLFSIRIIRIPQVIFEIFLIILLFLSMSYLSNYFLIIVLGVLIYWIIICVLHFFRIWPLIEE